MYLLKVLARKQNSAHYIGLAGQNPSNSLDIFERTGRQRTLNTKIQSEPVTETSKTHPTETPKSSNPYKSEPPDVKDQNAPCELFSRRFTDSAMFMYCTCAVILQIIYITTI